MFASQRVYWVEKIWRSRKVCRGDQITAKAFGFFKKSVHSFLASLVLTSLRLFARVIRKKASNVCLVLDEKNCCKTSILKKQYFVSRVWRWPDIKDDTVLKQTEDSSSSEEATGGMADCLCVNPFHFTKIRERGEFNSSIIHFVRFVHKQPNKSVNLVTCFLQQKYHTKISGRREEHSKTPVSKILHTRLTSERFTLYEGQGDDTLATEIIKCLQICICKKA